MPFLPRLLANLLGARDETAALTFPQHGCVALEADGDRCSADTYTPGVLRGLVVVIFGRDGQSVQRLGASLFHLTCSLDDFGFEQRRDVCCQAPSLVDDGAEKHPEHQERDAAAQVSAQGQC